MPARYDWSRGKDTDAEAGGDGLSGIPNVRWWPRVLLVALITAVVVSTAYRMLQRKADLVNQEAVADVRASLAVVIEAAEKGDTDLLTNFLSGRNPAWSEAVRVETDRSNLFSIPLLDVPDIEPSPEISIERIEVSPKLDTAQVKLRLSYPQVAVEGDADFDLIRPLAFRRGADRWLLSPPEAEYWGEQRSISRSNISISYSSQDEAIVQDLLVLLETTLDLICRSLVRYSCRPEFQIDVHFESDYSQLKQITPDGIFLRNEQVIVPSLALTGTPAGGWEKEKLLQSYQSQIVKAAVSTLIDRERPDHLLFYKASLIRLLADLKIQEWPLHPMDYEVLLADLVNLSNQDRIWNLSNTLESEAVDEKIALTIIEFILANSSTRSVFDIIPTLEQGRRYQSWLSDFNFETEPDDLHGRWMKFLSDRSLSEQANLSVILPEQDLHLLCKTDAPSSSILFRYDFRLNQFSVIDVADQHSFLLALPSDEGLITERLADEVRQTIVMQNGRNQVVYQADRADSVELHFTGLYSEPARQLLMYSFEQDRQFPPGASPIRFFRLAYGSCQWPDCELQQLAGLMLWSPDGSKSLVHYFQNQSSVRSEIIRGDAKGNPMGVVGSGPEAFWLDDVTYGYVSTSGEIILADSSADSILFSISSDDIAAAAAADRENIYEPVHVEAEQSGSGHLAILVRAINGGPESYSLLIYNQNKGDLRLVDDLIGVNPSRPQFSGNGKWLTIRTYEALRGNRSPAWSLYVYDPVTLNEAFVFKNSERQLGVEDHPPTDWSVDGRWLARSFNGYLMLTDTSSKSGSGLANSRIILPPTSQCDAVAWTDRLHDQPGTSP